MALSYEEAVELLKGFDSKEKLSELIKNLDVDADGDKTILYSGYNLNDSKDKAILDALINDPNNRILDKTDASRFLNEALNDTSEVYNEFKRILGDEPDIYGSNANEFLFGKYDADGKRLSKGAWDTISENFVKKAPSGSELDIYVNKNAKPDRVFFATEWEVVKDSNKFTKINGFDRSIMTSNLTTNEAFMKIQTLTAQKQRTLEALNNIDGRNLNINDIDNMKIVQVMNNTDGKYSKYIDLFIEKDLNTIDTNIKKYTDSINYKSIFKGLGVVGDAIEIGFVINQVIQAYKAGDEEGAKDAMIDWAVETTGGAAGAYVGGVVGGLAVAAATVLGVTVAAPAAFIIIAGASIYGAFKGTELAKYLYDEFDNIYEQMDDFVQKLSKLSFQSILDLMGVGNLDLDNPDNPNHNFLDLIPRILRPPVKIDPLVLDTNKDGFITNIPLGQSNAYFDITGDGIRENITWVGSEDGILVYDKNQNNVIDGISEVFGNGGTNIYSIGAFGFVQDMASLLNGSILGTIDNSTLNESLNGFDELKFVVDTNGDGKVDRKDELYNQLQIWNDTNGDGRASKDELSYLSDANIKSIDLDYMNTNIELAGLTLSQVARYTDSNGDEELAADLDLEYNPILTTVDIEDIPDFSVDPITNQLPHLKGYGLLIDTFISYNINDELKNKAIELSQDISKVATKFDEFIEIWSGYRGYINSIKEKYSLQGDIEFSDIDKKAWIAERLVNTQVYTPRIEKEFEDICKDYKEKDVSDVIVKTIVPSGNLTNYYNEYYHEELIQRYEGAFALNAFYSFEDLNYDSTNGRFIVDDTKVDSFYIQLSDYFNSENNSLEEKIYLAKIMNMQRGRFILFEDEVILDSINDTTTKELLQKSFFQDDRTIHVYEDNVNLNQDDAVFIGSNEDEIIKLSGDNTTAITSKGDDVIISAQGDNKYIFRAGDGNDVIYDVQGHDSIVFDGILKQDVSFSYENGDLIISYGDDRVVVQGWIYSKNRIENIMFQNDEVVTSDEIVSQLMISQDADYIEASLSNDTIDALSGDDTVLGLEGDDTLIGNKGDDTLQGGLGDDTYIFNIGDGKDTIYDVEGNDTLTFGENILKDDLIIKLIENDLIIAIKEDGKTFEELVDKITIKDWELLPTRVEKIKFFDGSSLGVQDIYLPTENDDNLIFANDSVDIDMLGGNDILSTGDADDIVFGNSGNDSLTTGLGDDTLDGGLGDDILNGGLGDDTYLYAKGDGEDIIDDSYYFGHNNSRSKYAGDDTLRFSEGISIDDLEVQLNGDDIVIGIKEDGKTFEEYIDTITIKNWLDKDKTIENIQLSDGSKVKLQDLQQATEFDDVLIYDSDDIVVDALAGNDLILTGDGNNTIYAGAGEDEIRTGKGDDVLYGGLGNDNLIASGGNDILEGGKHSDNLEGGNGNDTYIFNRGDGSDIIYDNYISTWLKLQVNAGNDTLKFGEGISSTDLIAKIVDSDLIIGIKKDEKTFEELTDKITIKDWTNSNNRVENLRLYDGSVVRFDSILQATVNDDYLVFGDEGVSIDGLAGNDEISTGNGDDIVLGGKGNDILITSDGNDILNGGLGDDILYGGSGKDTYIFNKGDGVDTIYDTHSAYNREDEKDDIISFGNDILSEDIVAKLVGKDMILAIKVDGIDFENLNDKIIIKDWTVSDNRRVEYAVFNDGTKVSVENLQSATLEDDNLVYDSEVTIDALAGDDKVVTSDGDDTLIGGKGDDVLLGQLGDDNYVFNRGDGQDTIKDTGGVDIISFGSDIVDSDLVFRRDADDLLIGLHEDGKSFSQLDDKLIIKDWFLLNNNIESIEFFDGSSISSATLAGYFVKDNIPGLIYSKPGAILFGEGGDDTYVYNKGDFTVTIEDSIFEEEIEVDAGNDKLILSGGINIDDVVFSTFGDDLIINIINQKDTYEELKDRVIIKNWQNENCGIEQIIFSNGETLDVDKTEVYEIDTTFKEEWYPVNHYIYGDNDNEISRDSNVIIEANSGNDIVTTFGGDDKLYGGEGDDTLIANKGKDFLDGGIGNDQLQAGGENDTYFYGRGYGHDTITDEYFFYSSNQDAGIDTIRFQSGIDLNDLIFQQYNCDLIIAIKEDGKSFSELTDKLTIKNWNDTNYKIESFIFSDGTYIDYHAVFDLMDKSFDDYISTSEKAESVTEELSLGFFNAVSDIAALGEDADKLTEVSVDLVGEILNMENVNANDEIYGGEGDDTIITREGTDILDGGIGNDRLEGGRRNDVYIFGRGYGHDSILDEYNYYSLDQDGGNDVIKFKEGIVASDLIFKQNNNNLIIAIKENGKDFDELSDKLTIENWNDTNYTIENLVFSDGSSLGKSDIHSLMLTEGDDIITTSKNVDFSFYSLASIFFNPDKSIPILESFDAHDTIYGGLGNDTISTGEGNDTLSGGEGIDILKGGGQNDTYIFGKGYGQDIILDEYFNYIGIQNAGDDKLIIDSGLSVNDLIFKQLDNDLCIGIKEDGKSFEELLDKLTITNWNDTYYGIENIVFEDGTILSRDDIRSIMIKNEDDVISTGENGRNYGKDIIVGGEGNDIITTRKGNDTLDGGIGNDILKGGEADDTYIFAKGYGTDQIIDVGSYYNYDADGDIDTINFIGGLTQEDLVFKQIDNDLIIGIKEDGKIFDELTDKLTITNWNNKYYTIENFIFSNGIIITKDDMYNLMDKTRDDSINTGNGADTIYAGEGNDIISTNGGNDVVYGGNGNDTINAGKGDDVIQGGLDNDIYVFNIGHGQDTIVDNTGKNIISFGDNIDSSQISYAKYGNDLLILKSDSIDKIVVKNWFINNNELEIQFADKTILDSNQILLNLIDGNNSEFDGENIFSSSENITIHGETGNDTYIYNKGDSCLVIEDKYDIDGTEVQSGVDKLILNGEINSSDIMINQYKDDLVIKINYDETVDLSLQDYILIKNWKNENQGVEKIIFSNGETLELDKTFIYDETTLNENLLPSNKHLYGYEDNDITGDNSSEIFFLGKGNDNINSGYGNDTLDGGAGNDQLNGWGDNDTYIFGRGYGEDTIIDYRITSLSGQLVSGGSDTIQFNEGITADDLIFMQQNNELVIGIKEDGKTFAELSDKLTITNWQDVHYRIENIKFYDNSSLSFEDIQSSFIVSSDDSISTNGGSDIVYGGKGNDNINSGYGNDTLDGGAGNDQLNGWGDNDTYIFGRGYGEDTIIDYRITSLSGQLVSGGSDTIQFNEGITADDLIFMQQNNELVIGIKEDGKTFAELSDKLTITNWNDSYYSIENFVFDNGITLLKEEIQSLIISPNDDIINMSNRNDTIYSGTGNDTIYSGSGDDTIYSGSGEDYLYGENGSDYLYAGEDDDILEGGVGSDYLYGENGSDTYVFKSGHGQDIIVDNLGKHILIFDSNVSKENFIFKKFSNDLFILKDNSADNVVIKDWFINNNELEIKIINETIITTEYILSNIIDGDLEAENTANTLYSISDTILHGELGNDTYSYNIGDGIILIDDQYNINGNEVQAGYDKLKFTGNITMDDLVFEKYNNDLIIKVNYNELVDDSLQDVIIIRNWQNNNQGIEEIIFNNGGSLTIDKTNSYKDTTFDINLIPQNKHLFGYEDNIFDGNNYDEVIFTDNGNDTINSGFGNDTLDGGSGDDQLNGSRGDDIYVFGRGYGQDTIVDHYRHYTGNNAGNDTIQFKEGITADDLIFMQNNSDLIIAIKEDGKIFEELVDKITVKNWTDLYDSMENFSFSDGSSLTKEDVQLSMISPNDDVMNGGDGDEVFYGKVGNDTINSGHGNDTLDGGSGDDQLNGSRGDDIYVFGRGYGQDTIVDHYRHYTGNNAGNDTIQFKEGITADDLIFMQNNSDLIIAIKEDGKIFEELVDKITVKNWNDQYDSIETLKFVDGTELLRDEIFPLMIGNNDDVINTTSEANQLLYGKEGNDTISSAGGNDIVYGGIGNDTINSGHGNDTLDGGEGDDTISSADGDDIVYAGIGNDTINSGHGDDTLDGGAGDDTINSSDGNDIIFSGIGNDIINSGNGNDTLDGEAGDDQLNGWKGNDAYIFGRGYGHDTISEFIGSYMSSLYANNLGNDTIQFSEGITITDLIFMQKDSDLIIAIKEDSKEFEELNDKLIIKNFTNAKFSIENFTFSNGDILIKEDILPLIITNNDDNILGGNGDDILNGGIGDDILNGLGGNDIYTFSRGDGKDIIFDFINFYGDGNTINSGGNDTIQFSEGIMADDLIFIKDDYDLVIGLKENGKTFEELNDKITISSFFLSPFYRIEKIEFISDSENNIENLPLFILKPTNDDDILKYTSNSEVVNALAGNDIIYTYEGDDTIYGESGDDTIYGGSGADTIDGGTEDDTIYAESGDDTIYGGSGADTIDSGRGDDTIYGGSGDDIIDSGSEADTIDGGSGDDTINGGSGDDTYLFGIGSGKDTILDIKVSYGGNYFGGSDSIQLKEGITVDDLIFMQEDNDLIIAIKEDGKAFEELSDKLILTNWQDEDYRIENIKFSDGTLLTSENILSYLPNPIYGTNLDDTLSSENNENTNLIFYGLDGNDEIYAGEGDDILNGGVGNDYLEGGIGSDTYIFEKGFGEDIVSDYTYYNDINTIKFGEGIYKDNLIFTKTDYESLEITFNIEGMETDKLIIEEFYNEFGIGKIEFTSDNTNNIDDFISFMFEKPATSGDDILVYTDKDNSDNINIVDGLEGDDIIYTNSGDDILNGGIGDDELYAGEGDDILNGGVGYDYLEGGIGSDTYIFEIGSGYDFIYDEGDINSTDAIRFGEGILKEHLIFENDFGNLQITFSKEGMENDILIIGGFHNFYNIYEQRNRIEKIEFLSDSTNNIDNLISYIFEKPTTNGDDIVEYLDKENSDNIDIIDGLDGNDMIFTHSGDDILNGNSGEDYLNGGNGNDILEGGLDNDYLYGEKGDDTYVFSRGDGLDSIVDEVVYIEDEDSDIYFDGGNDTIQFKGDITVDDLIIKLVESDLMLGRRTDLVIGLKEDGVAFESLSDKITIANWQDANYRVENIKFSDGTLLTFTDDQANYTLTEPTQSTPPIVLDMNLNGITSVSLEDSTAYFDYAADGQREHTAWIENGDALLVADLNNDGVINDGSELFGNYTKLSDGTLASDGYEALAQYDSNSDSIIDYKDNNYSKLSLWNDLNHNGKTDAGELQNIQLSTIRAIHLTNTENTIFEQVTENGNLITNETIYETNTDNGKVRDIWFEYDETDYITNNDTLQASNTQKYLSLKDGNDTYIYSLGDGLVTIDDAGDGEDTLKFTQDIKKEQIEVRWNKNSDDIILAIRPTIDDTTAVTELEDQILIKNWFNDSGSIETVEFSDGTILNKEQLFEILTSKKDSSPIITRVLSENGQLEGGIFNDVLYGSTGSELLDGKDGHDYLKGLDGDDQIVGGRGDDTHFGGKGDDLSLDISGDEYYIFNRGDGQDTIIDASGNDLIIFGSDISIDDLIIKQSEENLIIALNEEGVEFDLLKDTITIQNYLVDEYKIENLEFSNGNRINLEEYLNSSVDTEIVLKSFEVNLQEDNSISGSLDVTGNIDGIEFSIETISENSSLQIDELGNYTYTPNENFNGTEQIIVSVTNDYGETSTATIDFIIEAVNDTPIAKEDSAEVIENGTLTIQAIDILSNDIDVDENDVLTITDVSGVENKGVVSLVDGNVVFETGEDFDYLAEGESEEVILTYEMQDDKGASSSSTITVTVSGTNDAPVISTIQTVDILEDANILNGQIEARDVDNNSSLIFTTIQTVAGFTLNEDGSYSFDSSNEEYQSLSQGDVKEIIIPITVTDENGSADTKDLIIKVIGTNDTPIAKEDNAEVIENGTLTIQAIDILSNDIDVDENDVLTITDVSGVENKGVVSLVDGNVVFETGEDFDYLAEGESEEVILTYEMQDDKGASSSSTITVTVSGTNDAPVISTIQTVDILEDANILNGQIEARDVDNNSSLIFTTIQTVAGFTLNEDGSYSFDSSNEEYQSLSQGDVKEIIIPITVTDENGSADTKDLIIKVIGTNDTPIAKEDNAEVIENGTLTIQAIDILSNDIDVDENDVLTITDVSGVENKGVVSLVDGNVVFETGEDFDYLAEGESEEVILTYEMQDDKGASSSSTITVTVSGTNDAPVISTIQTVDILEDANILNGQIEARDVDNNSSLIFTTMQTVAGFTLNEDGSYSFDSSNEEYQSLSQGDVKEIIIPITVTDENGSADTKDLIIKVIGTNDTPIAKEDNAEVIENGTLTIQAIDILSNDIDVDENDVLTITDVSGVENKGVVSLVDGNVVFETGEDFDYLAEGESEEVILTYEMQDDKGASSSSTITVTVSGTNDAPIISQPLENIELNQELIKEGQIIATDIDGDVLAYSILSQSEHGNLKVNEDGKWIYEVDPTYKGNDSAIILIDDLNGGTVTKTLNFIVNNNPINGSNRSEFLFGSYKNDIINGLAGNDYIYAFNGDDIVFGGLGNDKIFGYAGNDTLYGEEGSDRINGYTGDDIISGGLGNDSIDGYSGNDTLYGDEGDDIINGYTGNDIIFGGSGNDYLNGSYGSDTYVYNLGDGKDTIVEFQNYCLDDINIIKFGEGIESDKIKFVKESNDLIIKINENDSILIDNWFISFNKYKIDKLMFSNGSVISAQNIEDKIIIEGTENRDNLYGSNSNDKIYALEGNDRIYAYSGDDILNGGRGDDILKGGNGDDTYVFGLGDGNDTIKEEKSFFRYFNLSGNDTVLFEEGISSSDIMFNWYRNDLIISYSDNDSIEIKNQRKNKLDIENIKLSDGSYLTNNDVENLIQNMISFAAENGVDLTNRNEVQNNSELMNIVNNSWHSAS
ncbi:MAG: calcium-binding protein [Halarcobacter sp.]